jgi:hypothetical protein
LCACVCVCVCVCVMSELGKRSASAATFEEPVSSKAKTLHSAGSAIPKKMQLAPVESVWDKHLVARFMHAKSMKDVLTILDEVCLPDCLDSHGAPTTLESRMLASVASLSAPKALAQLLVLAGNDAQSIGQRSYLHENGFYKLVLGKNKNFAIRMHHFCLHSKENVHDHRWPFVSTMLWGNCTFQLC